MSLPPTKTALGLEELRQRKRKLGQRHRTMLLLVDGRRSREEVIDLAQQAGVTPLHFDELIAWGMVDGEPLVEPEAVAELAVEASPQGPATAQPERALHEADAEVAAAPASVEALEPVPGDPELAVPPAPGVAADAVAASAPASAPEVELDMPAESAAEPGGTEAPPATPVALMLAPEAAASAAVPERLTITLSPPPVARPLPARRLAPTRRGAPRIAAASPRLPEPPVLALGLEPARAVPTLSEPLVGELPSHIRPVFVEDAAGLDALPAAGDADASEEDRLLGEVRGLLIGTLLVDAPVSSSLTALRVHRARDRESLVRLVWEVERSLVRARRPREAQARLGRARELLGLGNTVVHEHTLPGHPGGD